MLEKFDKFEGQIDSQAGIPFQSTMGKFKKYWPKFIAEKVDKVLNDPRRKKTVLHHHHIQTSGAI